MIHLGECVCPDCGLKMIRFGKVKRIVRYGNGKTRYVYIQQYHCNDCNKTHRALPFYIWPKKQYDARIIFDFINGVVTTDCIEFEDYPSEITVKRWKMCNKST